MHDFLLKYESCNDRKSMASAGSRRLQQKLRFGSRTARLASVVLALARPAEELCLCILLFSLIKPPLIN
ncbi:hypothetical protein L195_g047230, partial [Trifolium pratense]